MASTSAQIRLKIHRESNGSRGRKDVIQPQGFLGKIAIHSFIHPFYKCLLSTYYVLGLGVGMHQ